MNMAKIEEIKQKHLATKQRNTAEKAVEAKAHEDAVNALCERILEHLGSDAAYDEDDGTAWVEISYSVDDYGGIIRDTTRLILPGGNAIGLPDYDYGEERYRNIWRDVFNEFNQLEGFTVDERKITMLLED